MKGVKSIGKDGAKIEKARRRQGKVKEDRGFFLEFLPPSKPVYLFYIRGFDQCSYERHRLFLAVI